MEGTEIRDKETDEPVTWSTVFFYLHKHCNLNKWEIMEYTYPQVTELLSQCNKYIQFEVEIMTAPMKAMFGGLTGGGGSASTSPADDSDYVEIGEEDLGLLANALGGG